MSDNVKESARKHAEQMIEKLQEAGTVLTAAAEAVMYDRITIMCQQFHAGGRDFERNRIMKKLTED